MTKYESQVYTVNALQIEAFQRLADLRHFQAFKDALERPDFLEQLSSRIPDAYADQVTPEKIQQIRDNMQNVVISRDAISMETQIGLVTLAIVEREEPKLVKFQGVGTPVDCCLWVQFLPLGVYQTKLKVTVGVELNFFIRKMVESKIKDVPDGIGQFLSYVLAAPLTTPTDDFAPVEADEVITDAEIIDDDSAAPASDSATTEGDGETPAAPAE